MAENKNQHFVPKCHLRGFAPTADDQFVQLFNIRRRAVIANAPIRGQCSKAYFYGMDLQLERTLGKTEGQYAIFADLLSKSDYSRIDEMCDFFLIFSYLQFSRTEAMVQARRRFFERLHGAAFEGREDLGERERINTTDRQLAVEAIELFEKTYNTISDLSTLIIENGTNIDFITSDNPTVLTNRLHCQKMGRTNFGLITAGALLIMPISPRHAVVSYDRDVYGAPSKIGKTLPIERQRDINAINHLQVLNCNQNIYFQRPDDGQMVSALFDAWGQHRETRSHQITVMVPEDGDERRFRRATDAERVSAPRRLLLSSHRYPKPQMWIAALPYRPGAHALTDGSAAGLVRRGSSELRNGGPYRKVRV